jgi:hypothetical protein
MVLFMRGIEKNININVKFVLNFYNLSHKPIH